MYQKYQEGGREEPFAGMADHAKWLYEADLVRILQNAGFAKRFTRQKKRMARNNQIITDKELQVRLFNDFIRNTFISGENFRYRNGTMINEPVRYRLGPSFYFFRNNFYSAEYPVINAVFFI